MTNRIITVATGLLAMLAVAACGGNGGTDAVEQPQPQYPEKPVLSIMDGSILGNGEAVSLSLSEDVAGITAQIELSGDSGLSTLYTKLEYDPRVLSLESIETTDNLADNRLLSLGVATEPGRVEIGHVLPNFDVQPALDSVGTLATLRFSHGAQQALRHTANVPRSVRAEAPMTAVAGPMFSGSDALISAVQYTNPGDYDQNGIVTIADLTPLGLHFGKEGPFAADIAFIGIGNFPVESLVDGDGNGIINLADLTVIGQHFGNDALGGYNIYASSNPDDVPDAADAPSTIPPASSVAFGSGSGDSSTDRLTYGYVQPSAPAGPVTLWARPVDSEGNEGTVSQVVQMNGAPGPVLSLATAPISGSGLESDPHHVDPNIDYELMLNDGVDGDVTLSGEAQYYLIGGFDVAPSPGGGSDGRIVELRPLSAARETSLDELLRQVSFFGSSFAVPNVGEIDQEAATLDIVDIYQGLFSIIAVYRGRISNTLYLYAPDLDNLAPTALIDTVADSGVAPWTAMLSASSSSDFDGSIESYDWDLDGDGTYEIEDGAISQEVELTGGGEMTVRLRVTDDDLATSVATRNLSTEGWLSEAIDNVSDTLPADPMMQVIDGNPAIAYRRFNALYYVRAANPQGTEWNSPQAVPLSVTARHICLRELESGRPAMAYQRTGTEPGIYYVVGNAPDATSFQQVRVEDGEFDHSPSLNIIDGHPALAYVWYTGDVDDIYQIYYVRATDPVAATGGDWDLFNGASVWKGNEFYLDKTALTISQADEIGTDGRPSIWYVHNNDQYDTPFRAYFSRALNNTGTSWTPIPFSLADNTPGDHELQYPVATSITSRPYLLLRNEVTGGLLVRKSNNLGATDWSSPLYIADAEADDFGYHLASANVAGFLGLAYFAPEEQTITYRATETPEVSDGFPVGGVVASGVGEYSTDDRESKYISVTAALGKPLIAYHDLVSAELKVARYYIP